MADRNALTDLRKRELVMLAQRVSKRIKLRPGPKRIRRVAGIDVVLTSEALKAHVGVCLMSLPKMEVIEEAIATDELDEALRRDLGNMTLVPLILSVLKMLKSSPDVIVIKELSVRDEIPLSCYVGVISGKPAIGVYEKASSLRTIAKWEGMRRAGPVKIRGHRTPVGVVAGHLVTLRDASSLVKALAKETRTPAPVRGAALRVRAWEREWRRENPRGR